MKENPTSDEKVLAALAHATVLFSFFGPVGPTLIWNSQRNKSKYVRFHALQAMGYQAFAFWAWIFGIFFVVFGGILLSVIFASFINIDRSEMSAFPFILQPIIILSIFGLWGIFFLIGIIGAVFCMIDRDFRYPVIGKWLKKKLLDNQNIDADSEEWEDRWVAGVCHSTAILQYFGIITPLIVWFTQKERSAKVRFQALQAIFYQLTATIASILVSVLGGLLYFLFIFGMLAIGITSRGAANNTHIPPLFGILIIMFFGGLMLFWAISMIAIPLYYLLAAIASIRTIRGHEFMYPFLGKIIARKINAPKQDEVNPI
jgi:uncharacterized Tic20 family protein